MKNPFFTFWIKNIKISFILIFFIFFYGVYAIINIPKESSPKVKLGIIKINTVFSGVNPTDIDKLITEKIERNIKNVSGIKDFNSVSRTGFSSTTITLNKNADSTKVFSELENTLSHIKLPSGSERPKVLEKKTNNNFIFELLLYGNKNNFSDFELRKKAKELRNIIETNKYIEKIEIGGYRSLGGGKFLDENDYRIKVILNPNKIENLGLSIHHISNAIKSSNKNTTLGKQYIDGKGYNFYIKAKLDKSEKLLKTQIKTKKGIILLSDIAEIKKEYTIYRFRNLSLLDGKEYNFISLLFSKSEKHQINKASENIKKNITKIINNNSSFSGLNILYSKDLSSLISKDFRNLYKSALITIILVFIILAIFIGFKESIISIILLPISFFLTFIILYSLGFSLNIMTNFSLIIAFGIMIDTIIVIVEGVAEKRNKGFEQIKSVLLTLDEFKGPLISGTLTTLVASFPMMFFPGIVGKFISYIPITIFIAITSTLIITLTISSALFINFKSSKEVKEYSFLFNKIRSFRIFLLSNIEKYYSKLLKTILNSTRLIKSYIIIPIILLILSIIILTPKIGFTMFPNDDNNIIYIEFKSKDSISKEELNKKITDINKILNKYSEISFYYSTISNSNIFTYIELKDKSVREDNNLKTAQQLVTYFGKDFKNFSIKNNLNLNIVAENSGLSLSKNIGVKLVAQTPEDFNKLYTIGNDIKLFLENIDNTKNTIFSLESSNGSFVYSFDREKLDNVGLSTEDITRELYFYINGLNTGTIKSNLENNQIILYLKGFDKNLTPDKIENLNINTKIGIIRVGDFLNYKLKKSINSITRENGKIFALISTDVKDIKLTSEVQTKLDKYIEKYNFPEGVYIEKSGEIEENMETLNYAIKSFLIAIGLIFLILVFQFKSYSQSVLVLYSVIISIFGINIGLYLSGNSYSIPFIIGFISLAGIVVNDAIILVDVLNKSLLNKKFNNKKEYTNEIIRASLTRLHPIIVTTLTTVLGILPLLFQNKFWETFSYTVIFGLTVGSIITLIIVPIIYEIFYKKRFIK